MLITQLSDRHVGGARHHAALLRAAVAEINESDPHVVVVAGDITDEGYPDQCREATEQLEAFTCQWVVAVPGQPPIPSCRLSPARAEVRSPRRDPAL